jgi:hypothetical protein
MARDRRLSAVGRIFYDRMRSFIAKDKAIVAQQMPHELAAFHLGAPVLKRALSGISS